jgi:hypothetical protein
LQQGQAFACWAAQKRLLAVSAVLIQALLVLKELFPSDVAFVVLRQADVPVSHSDRVHPFLNLTRGVNLTAPVITAKDVPPCIGRILEDAQHTAVCQTTPYNLAIPRPTVGSFRKS